MYRSLCGLILLLGVVSLSPAFSEQTSIQVSVGDVLEYSPTANPVIMTVRHLSAPNFEYECLIMPGDLLQVKDIKDKYVKNMMGRLIHDGFKAILHKIDGQKGSKKVCALGVKVSLNVLKFKTTVSENGIPERSFLIYGEPASLLSKRETDRSE